MTKYLCMKCDGKGAVTKVDGEGVWHEGCNYMGILHEKTTAGKSQDAVREILKRFLMERGNPLYTFSQASFDILNTLKNMGWAEPLTETKSE